MPNIYCLCSDSFPDDQTKIMWALSYMKTGRVALWAARIFCWEEDNPGSIKFASWDKFREEFRTEFCPVHVDQAAINRLESVAYFQSKTTVDDYFDEFLDLISEAGYTDPKTIVVKFRRGLEPRIQDAIATMTSGRPSDMIPSEWYKAAKSITKTELLTKLSAHLTALQTLFRLKLHFIRKFREFSALIPTPTRIHLPEIPSPWISMLQEKRHPCLLLVIVAENPGTNLLNATSALTSALLPSKS